MTTLCNEPRVLCDYPKIIAVNLKHLPKLFSVKESETNIILVIWQKQRVSIIKWEMIKTLLHRIISYYLILSPWWQILNLRTFDANFVNQDLCTSSANYYELKKKNPPTFLLLECMISCPPFPLPPPISLLKMPFPNRLFPNLLSWKGLKKQILKCQSFQEKGHIFSFIRQQYCYIAT